MGRRAITAETAVPGCATGATHLADAEAAARFMLEAAKAYGRGECCFYDEEEYARILELYGPMNHLQTLGERPMRKKIGALTIGQAPRVDVTGDLGHLFGPHVELIEAGALTRPGRDRFLCPRPRRLCAHLPADRRQLGGVAERYVLPLLQQRIHALEQQGVSMILFFCTGDFPDDFTAGVPLIFPYKILNGLVPALTSNGHIAVLTPKPEQVAQAENKWKHYVRQVTVVPASPYGDIAEVEAAAHRLKGCGADLVVMDCIGYNVAMKRMVADITGINVLLSRTILARVAAELIS